MTLPFQEEIFHGDSHQVREKDEELGGNLKAAPAISSKVTNFYYFAFHQGLVFFQPGLKFFG